MRWDMIGMALLLGIPWLIVHSLFCFLLGTQYEFRRVTRLFGLPVKD